MSIMISFAIAKKQTKPKNLESTRTFIRLWIYKLLYTHTIKYYTTWKINEINILNKDASQKHSQQKKQITEEFTIGFNLWKFSISQSIYIYIHIYLEYIYTHIHMRNICICSKMIKGNKEILNKKAEQRYRCRRGKRM